ncbi:hypothetical protein AB4K20DRAFT_1925435 [Rhizopus microsporus]
MTLTTAMIGLHSVFAYKSCGIMWQCDLNASKNIFKISKNIITEYEINNVEALLFFSYRHIEHGFSFTRDLNIYR